MANDFLPWQNPTVTDERLDTESLTVNALNVHRERIQVTGAVDVAIAGVLNASPTTEYGLVTRNIPSGTQAVSGTVTAAAQPGVDIGDVTVNNAAGASAVNIQDGGNSITVDGSVSITGAVDTELSAAAALADNTVNPTVTSVGTFPHWFDGVTWDRALGNSTDGLLVNLGANNDVTVTGTVTANAGTNLNTSALNLEATQASILTSVQLIDDAVATLGTTTYAEATTKALTAGVLRRDADTSAVNTDNEIAPLLVDASGFLKVNVKAGSAGGTEYVEDAAAAANPQAPALIMVRADTPATVTDANGDNVALRATNYGAAYVQIVSSAGAFVDSFGGGTQYTEGDVDATITGTAAMMEVAANTLQPVQGTVADGLLVNLGANNDVTVTGTVTANAGTNLNTSALNLETTQTSVLTSVQLIDDTIVTMGTDTYTEAVSKGQNITAVRRDADTTLVGTTNEFGPLQMDANGRLKVEAFSGETLPVSLTSTTITGQVQVGDGTNAVVVVTDGADNLANTNNELVTAALVYGFDGTNWDRVTNGGGTEATALRVTLANDSTGLVSVDDNGGSLTVDGTVTVTATDLDIRNLVQATDSVSIGDGTNLVVVLADGADNTSNSNNQLVTAAMNYAFDGTTWDRVTNGAGTATTAMRVVQANDAGKTILSTGGSAAASGNNTLVAAGTNRLKVHAFSLTTTSTTAMTCIFQSGASGTELWRVIIQAPTGANAGANLAVTPPGWLFATASATLLNLNLSSANAVHWSLSYVDEA